jgi:hypothetical protein
MLDSAQANASESIVQKNASKVRQANSVRAMFEDGMSTFLLSYDATFEELAGRLGHLAEKHQGRPISVDVKLGSLAL